MARVDLIKSLSMTERMNVLIPHYSGNEDQVEDQLSNWQKRKSLCTRQHFEEYTQLLGITPKAFNIGIKRLNNKDKELLLEAMQEKAWFKLNQQIFTQVRLDVQVKPVNFSYVIRYHINYFQKQLKEKVLARFQLDEVSLKRIVDYAQKDLLSISLKTLVFDLHEQKRKTGLEGETAEERFSFYLTERFSSRQCIQIFFEEYPVLWRLLAERLQFHLDNFTAFIDSLEQSMDELKSVFQLSRPFQVSIDSMGNSDSHNKGKTVILFQINDQKLVFKFKNLTVGQRWNEFLSIIEQETGSSFYKVKRLATKGYTIEEFVEQTMCTSEKEVSDYYYRFGEYTAICYFLCGNDFHAENIIACGSHPVIIDIETLLQNDHPVLEVEDVYSKAIASKNQSVLSTSLLPATCFDNRIEPKVNEESNSLEVNMSGFSGGKQLLPFKVLKLVEENTDNVHFEYVEQYSQEKNNIPILNGQRIDPINYTDSVMRGFVDQYDFFVSNKQVLIGKIKALFDHSQVRCILKSTQQYYDMIDYGNHSSCMKDHLEREKLFENQWAFSYKNKKAIQYEIEELLTNDVPIFFTNVSTRNLLTSSGKELKDYYSRTVLDRVQARIEALSEEDKAYQLVILKSSLGNYFEGRSNYPLSDSPEKQLEDIGQYILKRAIFDRKHKKAIFLDFILENKKRDFGVTTIDFYDGMTGIYLFLLYYNTYYPTQKLQRLVQALENLIFDDSENQLTTYSVYSGKLSILVAVYYRYRLLKDEESLKRAHSIVSEINDNLGSSNYKSDWLSGVSGLIKLLSGFYKVTKDESFIKVAKQLAKQINLSEIKLSGLSHGYSGVILALNELQKYLKEKQTFSIIIQKCLERERGNFDGQIWSDLRENVNFTTQWCHGCTGIGLTRLELLKAGFRDETLQIELNACVDNVLAIDLEDDCLCHGNTGSYIFLSEVYKEGCLDTHRNSLVLQKLTEIERKLLDKGVTLEGMSDYPTLGFMTGLAGIGFNWLRMLHPEIPNLLIVE